MRRFSITLTLAALAALSACTDRTDETAADPATNAPEESLVGTPDPNEPVSIIRPEIEQPEGLVTQILDLNETIGFPGGGSALDDAAISILEDVATSVQVEEGGPITLRAHSDAGGNDAVNMRVSQARGGVVLEWLTDNGVPADRISVIAFGEQNPVEPNALPNGEPNEAGRAANRRVDIEVSVEGSEDETATPDETPDDS